MVRELLREDGLEWDIELVRGLFLPQDAEAILSIPVSESTAKDRMVWAEDKKGHFSIRSAYRLARELVAGGVIQVIQTRRKCREFGGGCGV